MTFPQIDYHDGVLRRAYQRQIGNEYESLESDKGHAPTRGRLLMDYGYKYKKDADLMISFWSSRNMTPPMDPLFEGEESWDER